MVEGTQMSDRQNIFALIREALAIPAPKSGAHGGPDSHPQSIADVLPPAAVDMDSRIKQFQANATGLKADFVLADNEADAVAKLKEIAKNEGWKKIATHRGALSESIAKATGLPVCYTDANYQVNDLESCDAGLTECDALVAQTGSVLVTSRSTGGRALSVLPPHHVVLARKDQIISSLPDAFKLVKDKYGSDFPSMISFITGPSRTGDIERILVLGAHGPKKLTIICF